jgi:hypothetical protein
MASLAPLRDLLQVVCGRVALALAGCRRGGKPAAQGNPERQQNSNRQGVEGHGHLTRP